MAGIGVGVRLSRWRSREDSEQPGGSGGVMIGGKGRGEHGNKVCVGVDRIYSCIQRELKPRNYTENGRRNEGEELVAGWKR